MPNTTNKTIGTKQICNLRGTTLSIAEKYKLGIFWRSIYLTPVGNTGLCDEATEQALGQTCRLTSKETKFADIRNPLRRLQVRGHIICVIQWVSLCGIEMVARAQG